MSRLKDLYKEKIIAELKSELGRDNVLSLPTLEKIVVNMGVGRYKDDKAYLEEASQELAIITGQKPSIRKARKAISGFKLRQGDAVGLMVTLRGERMWSFFDKLVNVVLPRWRDFRGVSRRSFDKQGNYNLGISELGVFPDLDANKASRPKSLMVSVVTSARNKEEAAILLEKLGLAFTKKDTADK